MSTEATAAEAGGAPASIEQNHEIPVQTSAAEPVVVATEAPPEDTAPEATAPAAGASESEQREKPQKVPDWLQKKMAADAFEARETKRRLEAAEAELAKLRTPAPAPNAADTAAAQQNAPQGGYKSPAEFDAAVQAEATRRQTAEQAQRDQEAFDANCNTAYANGKTAFGDDFDIAVSNLQQLGAMNRDMLDLALNADDPAKLLFELGSDPDRAASIMALPPAKRAIEIAKLSVTVPPKAAPTPLSRAPRPVEPVEGSARPNGAPSDNDDDATWFAKRNAEVAARHRAHVA